MTVIKLLDGTKAYLHAVIDNFSRRILSWRLAERLDPTTTCEILTEASKNLELTPTVVADSGVENVNGQVDQLTADGLVHRVLAQVEVSFSNSMIEAFWRSLRHQWLYLHSLDSFTQLKQLIDFYVKEHNTQMPHHAFVGQTPVPPQNPVDHTIVDVCAFGVELTYPRCFPCCTPCSRPPDRASGCNANSLSRTSLCDSRWPF